MKKGIKNCFQFLFDILTSSDAELTTKIDFEGSISISAGLCQTNIYRIAIYVTEDSADEHVFIELIVIPFSNMI